MSIDQEINTKTNQKQQISEQAIPIRRLYPHPAHPAHPFLSSFTSAALLLQALTSYAR